MIWIPVLIGILIILFFYLIFPAVRRHPDRALLENALIAHRGLHDLSPDVPENSLAAFSAACEKGFAIENDLRITADGAVVVFHDNTLKRACGADGCVEEKTLSELKELRLGESGETIPTLSECLETVGGRVLLLIELKCTKKTCRRLCAAADRILADYRGKYLIQSFYPPALFWYRRHRPEICRGQLAAPSPEKTLYKKCAGALLFNFLSRPDFISYYFKGAQHPVRRLCTKLGAFPVGWTFRTPEDLKAGEKAFRARIFEGFISESR